MRHYAGDEELERQARIAGVAAEVFGSDVLEGRAERIGSLQNGPRKTLVTVDRSLSELIAANAKVPDPASSIEAVGEQRLATVAVDTVDHLAERQDPRRVTSVRELHEAADLAEQGTPLPGTLAHAKLTTAQEEGDFALASQIRERVKQLAPMLRDAAVAAEEAAKATTNATVRDARANLDRIEAAKQKRARKAERRLHEVSR